MRLLYVVILLLAIGLSSVWAADISPPPQLPQPAPSDPSRETPQRDSASDTPDSEMVIQPDTIPHPDSVVTPPVIDPKMAIDPEAKSEEERHPTLQPEEPPSSDK